MKKNIAILCLICFLFPAQAFALSVVLPWEYPTEDLEKIDGFKIYYSIEKPSGEIVYGVGIVNKNTFEYEVGFDFLPNRICEQVVAYNTIQEAKSLISCVDTKDILKLEIKK